MTPLRQRMTEDMQLRNLGLHTQRAYLQHVSQFAGHFHRSPELLGPAEIRAFQLHLSRDRQLAASSVGVAVAALRFLYKVLSQNMRRTPSLMVMACSPQGRSAKVRSYRLWVRLDRPPQSGHAVRQGRERRVTVIEAGRAQGSRFRAGLKPGPATSETVGSSHQYGNDNGPITKSRQDPILLDRSTEGL